MIWSMRFLVPVEVAWVEREYVEEMRIHDV